MYNKILIANRGEIACRIIRTCRRLGIGTVAVFSQADSSAQHVRLADEAHLIGGPLPSESYLRGNVIIDIAKQSGAQAVHPGYGFLSENAEFADAVENAGLTFIGPKAASMRKMGSKAGAKELMQQHGVPVVPGYTGEDQNTTHLQAQADRIGYPLMIKAAHGGGGKGMRIVRTSEDFVAALESCQREARNAFGKDRVLLERYIERPRHIEIQVFADNHGNTIHLNERECSAQRRYQKIIEESPSPFLTPALRKAMGEAAVKAAEAIDYRNAGTVEFIVAQNGEYFFMEINTRLQVEHPVTEMTTGLDLVEWQLQIALGKPLPIDQSQVIQRGHAIEVRLYAEDPAQGFLPGSGKLDLLRLPTPGEHVRIDAGVIQGDTVTIFYDPMIAKLIVWDIDRPHALARLRDALAQTQIIGPKSNIAFLESLIRHHEIINGTIDTGYLDRALDEVLIPGKAADRIVVVMATAACLHFDESQHRMIAQSSNDANSPWYCADGWRLGHSGERILSLDDGQTSHSVYASGYNGFYQLRCGNQSIELAHLYRDNDWLCAHIDGQAYRMRAAADTNSVFVHDSTKRWLFNRVNAFQYVSKEQTSSAKHLHAPMPGRIVVIHTETGKQVNEGDVIAVMEAMKMELSLKSPRDGIIAEVRVTIGDFVEADTLLISFSEEQIV